MSFSKSFKNGVGFTFGVAFALAAMPFVIIGLVAFALEILGG